MHVDVQRSDLLASIGLRLMTADHLVIVDLHNRPRLAGRAPMTLNNFPGHGSVLAYYQRRMLFVGALS
jgi:hypothetical protein